ncbi:DUF1018 domain-containing protein [Brevibacillus borstelensis]|uniref:phage protein GemA/Gp16 family protein n=1 Tax=Brevibacillus borstelensis TaxID=45462 RepID=UPI002E20AF59|nr:DUF1018 domain-containing protein [Brevibacillus borstelensis]
MKITAEQRRKIFGMQRQYGLSEEDLYSVVEQVSGARSISQLTKESAKILIDRLGRLVGEQPPKRKMASKQMLWKIRQLEQQLGWNDNPKRLQAFMRKYAGVDRLEWLTQQKAWKLVESLKKMLEKQQNSAV